MIEIFKRAADYIYRNGGQADYGLFDDRLVLKFDFNGFIGQFSWWQSSKSLNLECITEEGADVLMQQSLEIDEYTATEIASQAFKQVGVTV